MPQHTRRVRRSSGRRGRKSTNKKNGGYAQFHTKTRPKFCLEYTTPGADTIAKVQFDCKSSDSTRAIEIVKQQIQSIVGAMNNEEVLGRLCKVLHCNDNPKDEATETNNGITVSLKRIPPKVTAEGAPPSNTTNSSPTSPCQWHKIPVYMQLSDLEPVMLEGKYKTLCTSQK